MENIEKKIAATVAQQNAEDFMGKFAASLALPGPLVDIFAPQPAIQVGKYSVRPFFDADFEFLQLLKHPFAAFAVGQTAALETFVPRGPEAWQLFWIMTNPVEVVDAEFTNHGETGVKAAARREFGSYQLGALFAIYQAIVKQLTVYASSVVGYGPADSGAEGEDAKEQRPPSGAQSTG